MSDLQIDEIFNPKWLATDTIYTVLTMNGFREGPRIAENVRQLIFVENSSEIFVLIENFLELPDSTVLDQITGLNIENSLKNDIISDIYLRCGLTPPPPIPETP